MDNNLNQRRELVLYLITTEVYVCFYNLDRNIDYTQYMKRSGDLNVKDDLSVVVVGVVVFDVYFFHIRNVIVFNMYFFHVRNVIV
mmetsp:Transcript_28227/g.33410  ORF Transcript_28227/g.33410 Transcript_28227/m.33410 type:complete len:85 (-) Transcript_28227:1212-1466(-)